MGFFHWPGLPSALQGTVSDHVVHVSDWLPTYVHGVAGLELVADEYR